MPQPLQKLREYARKHDETLRQGTPVLGVLAVLVLVIVGIWVVWKVPQWQVQHSLDTALQANRAKQLELEDAFRKTIAQIVLSVFGLFILWFTWRRARAGDATVRIMEQGHITDRFTKAIEQLGKLDGDRPNIEVRLGAIYALERIAIDSPRDHWTIMEVLTAYVRQNAPLDPDRPCTGGEIPRTDIQAILTVLGRRETGLTHERPGQRLDLSSSRLCGADLTDAIFQDIIFYRANLQGVELDRANLQGANLTEVNFQYAYLDHTKMQNAKLKNANMQNANCNCACLQKAFLNNAKLRGVDFDHANLQGANLTEADLQDAYLDHANLEGAILTKANLTGAGELTKEQVRSARQWETAHYSPHLRNALGLPTEEPIEPDASSHPDPDKLAESG